MRFINGLFQCPFMGGFTKRSLVATLYCFLPKYWKMLQETHVTKPKRRDNYSNLLNKFGEEIKVWAKKQGRTLPRTKTVVYVFAHTMEAHFYTTQPRPYPTKYSSCYWT